jgi:hypothetical protein
MVLSFVFVSANVLASDDSVEIDDTKSTVKYWILDVEINTDISFNSNHNPSKQ